MRRISLLAIFAAAALGAACPVDACAQTAGATAGALAANPQTISKTVALLLRKYTKGGRSLALAVARLLENDPSAIDAVVTAAERANPEQKSAMAQGIAFAVAFLKQGDPGGAKFIEHYMAANEANPFVADIVSAENAQASTGTSTLTGAGSVGGSGGGGFSGGGGGQKVSPN